MNSDVVKRCALAVMTPAHKLARKAGASAARLSVVAGAAVAATGAHAAPVTIDTTEIVATISGGVTAISAIGVAVVSLVVVIKLYKWVQRVL